jgi:hypothetical protein
MKVIRNAHQRKYAHGLSAVKAAVTKYGIRAIDGRSKLAYALRAWQRELIADLGGDDNITVQQRTIIEMASTSKLMISSVDAWIVSQPSLITRQRALMPVIVQRQQLVNGLVNMMSQLGLERQHKVATLTEILQAEKESE